MEEDGIDLLNGFAAPQRRKFLGRCFLYTEEWSVSNLKDNRIITSELCYAYPEAEKNAVDHVNMRVKKGEFLAILGHNGSGKSTLARLFSAGRAFGGHGVGRRHGYA